MTGILCIDDNEALNACNTKPVVLKRLLETIGTLIQRWSVS